MASYEYHFVITVMAQLPSGEIRWRSKSGSVYVSGTRKEVFEQIFNETCAEASLDPKETFVIHYTMEPNEF